MSVRISAQHETIEISGGNLIYKLFSTKPSEAVKKFPPLSQPISEKGST